MIFLKNLCLPLFFHAIIVAVGSEYDPCNGNPGCMAGSPTIFFVLFVSIPVAITLLIAFFIQAFSKVRNYKKYFKINMGIALIPIILVGSLVMFIKELNAPDTVTTIIGLATVKKNGQIQVDVCDSDAEYFLSFGVKKRTWNYKRSVKKIKKLLANGDVRITVVGNIHRQEYIYLPSITKIDNASCGI